MIVYQIRAYQDMDLDAMISIWNQVVEEGMAFPQEEPLDRESGAAFFASQTASMVMYQDDELVGLYILHPNNVGRCGHICNASYAVRSDQRGKHLGEYLVRNSLNLAALLKFRIMQFNAVVEDNHSARHLYERLGFRQLGTIPGGFRNKDGEYVNICPYYCEL